MVTNPVVVERQLVVERRSFVSTRSFSDVIAALSGAIGHPDMAQFWKDIAAAKTYEEVDIVVGRAIGSSGFMEFARLDHGQFLHKIQAANTPRIVRLIIGNPLIMVRMAEHVHDAGSYAPVTILIDERPDGVHLSYDSMASFLASYGNLAALEVARSLDEKVAALLQAAAS
jgi:uncharacterized protein (DUF302 family)